MSITACLHILGRRVLYNSLSLKFNRPLTDETSREKSFNSVQLIGRTGADPRVAGGPDPNRRVTIFSLATNEYQGMQNNVDNGESTFKQRVDWHRICVFVPQLRENVEKYLRQGDRVFVRGRLHYDLVKNPDKDNSYITSIVADEIIFLTKKAVDNV
ncbi:hypothetical protein GJ496_002173 [Pomphorhynchus laevis]|nr:hypothetical protein GJ496_002173 [Pomphorhynchus laevis]